MRGILWFVISTVWSVLVATTVVVLAIWPLAEETTALPNAELWRDGRWTAAGAHDCYTGGSGRLQRVGDRVVFFDCGAAPLVWSESSQEFTEDDGIQSSWSGCGDMTLADGRSIGFEDGQYQSPPVPGFGLKVGNGDSCTEIARRDTGISNAMAAALEGDRFLVIGVATDDSGNPQGPLAAGIAHDGTWTELANVPIHDAFVRAVAPIDRDRVLVVVDNTRGVRAHVLDVGTSRWEAGGDLRDTGDQGMSLVPIGGGRVVFVGGRDGRATYVWENGRFARSGQFGAMRHAPALLALDGGRVLAAGGIGDTRSTVPQGNVVVWAVGLLVILVMIVLASLLVWKRKPNALVLVAGLMPGILWGAFAYYVVTNLTFGHGRPLRVGGSPRRARIRRVGPRRRDRTIADHILFVAWVNDARLEEASVTAFTELARELGQLDAPGELVAWAERAADEERDHARRCATIAARYGAAIETLPLEAPAPMERPRSERLARLAVDSLVDGCMGEGFAARAAHESAASCTDVAIGETLRTIAVDEASHAELAWAVLAFCLREGGAPVRVEVERAIDALARDRFTGLAANSFTRPLAAHGRLVEEHPGALDGEVRREVVARARSLEHAT